jgi:hypothetical protein
VTSQVCHMQDAAGRRYQTSRLGGSPMPSERVVTGRAAITMGPGYRATNSKPTPAAAIRIDTS